MKRRFAPCWAGLGIALFLLWATVPAFAHVGSPAVFYEGQAGPYPVRVVVRPPEVIPGLAEVSVRVASDGVERVTALPLRWDTGHRGAPPPDVARSVRGETNLYSAQLWFMQGGAQAVEVRVSGRAGPGKVMVPVDATARRVLAMPRALGRVLFGLGAGLFLLLVSIIGAATREGVLPPGTKPSRKRLWLGRASTVAAALVLGGLLWLGNRWWASEAADYRHNRLYRPLEAVARVETSEQAAKLHLEIPDQRLEEAPPLVPDHGKLMHLFLVREPGMDVFAHLHPQKLDWRTFETVLPALPPGQYTAYGDVTFETGFSDTLTARLDVANPPPAIQAGMAGSELPDPDDAWRQAPVMAASARLWERAQKFSVGQGQECIVEWIAHPALVENQETALRFSVHDLSGRLLTLDPYLGMAGHLVLRRDDGAVFTHLHPGGSFSMAAQRLLEMRDEGQAPFKVAGATNDPICQLPTAGELNAAWLNSNPEERAKVLSFPYAFPRAGRYRLWLQVKVRGEILTGVFDTAVVAAR